jgi:glycosyltransferase involved in cell wall biosynthesis
MINLIKKLQIDVIYFESVHLWNLLIMFRFRKLSLISAIHDVIPHENGFKRKKIQFLYHLVIHRSDKIILRNRKHKELFLKQYNIKSNKVDIIPLWIGYPEFERSKNGNKVLFFGRLNEYKGVRQLPEIARRCPEMEFIVAGKADEGIKDILQDLYECPNIKLEERFIDSEEIGKYYKNSNWVILPYKTASQSGIVVDAYKFSKPVIAYDVGAISEQIENGKTGYLIKSSDLDAFVECLKMAINLSYKAYSEICHSAFLFGQRQFSVEVVKVQFLKSLEGLRKG